MWSRSIKYELLERLGEGGQGCVFKALRRDPVTGLSEMVALKVLHSETTHSLWRKEFESLKRVRSPYCVQVLSFDRVDGRPSLVLEFVDGASLNHLGRSGLLDESDIEEILSQIELALLDLNRSDIFHGDLSPGNVLIDREGSIKLLDFGLANSGGTEARLTPDFASPERLAGEHPSLASDLYSLGAIEGLLRGKWNFQSPYLAHDPAERKPAGRKSQPRRRRALAAKVIQWQNRQRWATTTQTLTSPRKNWKPRVALVLCSILLLLISPGAVPYYNSLPAPAVLSIRTLNWHRIYINGRLLGYAPIQIPVDPSQTTVLEWISALGKGRKVLRTEPGQRIVMGDRDFRGSHGITGRTPQSIGTVSR
jgi:serine/threonine protein kinase